MSVYKKLMEARLRLQAMPVKKGGENTFAKYKYLELGDFLPQTQAIFHELGLCGIVSFTADTAELRIIDTDPESMGQIVITSPMGSAALKGCHEVQNIGAVETYQRRYLWVTAMEIVEHDALDSGKHEPDLEVMLTRSIEHEQEKQKRQGVMGAVLNDIDLTPEQRVALTKLAAQVKQHLPATAYEVIEEQGLNNDERLYLWSLLDSKTRSALKREKTTRSLTAGATA